MIRGSTDTSAVIGAVAVLIALATALLFYWSRNQEVYFLEYLPDTLEYYTVGKHPSIVSQGSDKESGPTIIKAGSGEYAAIKTWFEKNTSGWKNDINDYAPNRVLKSKTLTVNILEKRVIVNYTSDGKSWYQVSKPKSKDDHVF